MDGSWKAIERRATPADLVLRKQWQQKQVEAMINCRARAAELELEGIKIVAAEYSYDGSRLVFLFSTETEDKVDLKSLRKDMQKIYTGSQVELRQIGPRDVAKMIGGMGACGLETRCCSKFLTEFSPISIKMAKEQGISLTPSEITGMCGRLRCCLIYEYEQYVEARKELPKRGKKVLTPQGKEKWSIPIRYAMLWSWKLKDPAIMIFTAMFWSLGTNWKHFGENLKPPATNTKAVGVIAEKTRNDRGTPWYLA